MTNLINPSQEHEILEVNTLKEDDINVQTGVNTNDIKTTRENIDSGNTEMNVDTHKDMK